MKLAKGESILVDDLVLTGFVDIHVVVSITKKLILTGVTNRLFHISSTNFMTRYEFAKSYSKIFKRDENLVIKSVGVFSKTDSTEEERVLMKFKLDTRNIQDFLNMQMMDIEESLRYTHKRFTSS
jgi:dTDP-4-dehydrorhamnose reductase